jgi:Mg-chelatase subunit ChlD
MKLRLARPLRLLASLLAALALLAPPHAGAQIGPAAVLPKPSNISCQGYERDTVAVYWQDNATDETNYRVERSVAGAPFSEVVTINPNAEGNYPGYKDTGADVSSQNRRYRVRAFRSGDSSFSVYSDVCNNRRIFENTNFRVFYGLRGTSDDCPQIDGRDVCLADTSSGGTNTFVGLQGNALQGSVDGFGRVGFTRSAGAAPGSLDKIPINIVWCDGGGCAGGGGLGISPLLAETPFDLAARTGDPVAYMVALHEAFHFQQGKYGGLNDPAGKWVVEGQARSIQDKVCIGANRATCLSFDDVDTGYAGYVPELQGYLGNPNRPINQTDYQAVLFWTYLTEKFGTSAPGDTVEAGMNLIVKFWEDAAANPGRDGITILNSTLASMGHSQRFRDIWKDFAVASYAKDITGAGVQAKYKYADMAQPGGSYGGPALSLSRSLALNEQAVDSDETVTAWGARYYELRPDAGVPVIDVKFTQDSNVPLYYTVLGIKGNDVAYEYNVEARNLSRTLINDGFSKVVVVVAGLESLANYRYSINGTQPTLRITSPTTANKARVGSPASPDKFRVAVEVLAGDGTPLDGVSLDSFSFRVGAVDVPAGNIITSATVQGQHWFVLRAPAQLAGGLYDLRVSYGGSLLSSTQAQAVDYTPRSDADSVLVIDRSGSMGDSGKLTAAQAAARLYVDSWRQGDKIGVVSFNGAPAVSMSLRDWTDAPAGGSRQTAFTAINGLTPTGATAIGDAVRSGWNQITASGNMSHDWALVLLSDGLETAGSESFDTLIGALTDATGKRPAVHAVAVGQDADRLRMQRIASNTGGSYQFISEPGAALASIGPAATGNLQLDLDARYRSIAAKVIGQQQNFSLVGPLSDGVSISDTVPIPIESGAAELLLSLSWAPGSIGTVTLRNPSNAVVAATTFDSRHRTWRVPTPAGGTWSLFIETQIPSLQAAPSPNQPSEFLPPYLVQASLRSDVTMDVYLPTPLNERTPGVAMPIIASLTDTGPIRNATVNASVIKPGGASASLKLYDNGTHGDGAADDGLYTGTFYQTGAPGTYALTVSASGTSPLSGAFTRQDVSAFDIHSGGDTDGDGLPDEWEIRFGTNPNLPDGGADPDNDGSNNANEQQRGTDPTNPDTDNGGESDGTDPDPLDPADDRIKPTWAVAYPGDGEVFVKYVVRPEYAFVGFFRGGSPQGPFTFVGQNTPGTGIFTDTNVTNGSTYCYVALALDALGRRSGGLSPSCATPKADPLGPHGGLLINNGARSTPSTSVSLTLIASDAVDPEHTVPGDEVLLPRADSASGVAEMMISNSGDMAGGAWEPYAPTKPWTLAQASGLATVFVKYRDAAGNESAVYPATIRVGGGGGTGTRLLLPLVAR